MSSVRSAFVVGIPVVDEDVVETPSWRWWLETAAVGCLAAAAILGPLALGGTHAYGRLSINVLVAAATLIWILSAPRSGWLAWSPLAIAALASIQIVPLPLSVLGLLSPFSRDIWAGVDRESTGGWGTISIDPGVTAAAIRQIFLGLSAVVVTMDLCRDNRRRLMLAAAITLSGLLIWGLGLAFPMNDDHVLLGRVKLKSPAPEPWWCTTLVHPVRTAGFVEWSQEHVVEAGADRYLAPRWQIGDGIGPYICSNHYAAGLYLTIPIFLALCRQRLRGPVWGWAGATLAVFVLLAAFWTVESAAHSRAGAIASLLGMVLFLTLSSDTPLARRLWAGVLALTVVGLVVATLVFQGILPSGVDLLAGGARERLEVALADERVALTQAAVDLFREAPLLGTGLGTYGFLQRRSTAGMHWVFYAHNDMAQFLSEAGLCGVAVGVAIIGIFAAALRRTWRAQERDRVLAAGAWAALAAMLFHSFFDWNMHVPANALLTCLAAGLALSTTATFPTGCVVPEVAQPAAPGVATPVDWSARRGSAAVLLAGACVVTALLSARDCDTETAARKLRYALMSMRTAKDADARTLAIGRLQWGIVNARRAHRRHPSDSELALLAGQAALHLDAEDEALEGETPRSWFDRARACNPVMWGFPESFTEPDAEPAG